MNGIKIAPGYDMALVLYHIDYPVINDPELHHRVGLDVVDKANDSYREHIILIQKIRGLR